MSMFDYFIIFITSYITVYIELWCYSKLSKDIYLKPSLKVLIVTFIACLIIAFNTYTNESISRLFISFIILLISSMIIYKDCISKSILYTLLCFIIAMFYEILFSSLIMVSNIVDMKSFDNNSLLKMAFSFITIFPALLTSYIPYVRKISQKITSKIGGKTILIIFTICLICLVIIDFKYYSTFSPKVYRWNIFAFICVMILFILSLYNYFVMIKENEKTDVLLKFMSKYEKIIDDSRIHRHELLNNLLTLKSIENKNDDNFNNLLDELIDSYTNKSIKIKNIHFLPSGLKGIFYYKLNGLSDKGYNITFNVSKMLSKEIKKIPHDTFVIVSKIVGIVLDNAIDASLKTKEKYIGIDIYKEDNIIIEINNSFKGKINLELIKEKYYSTNKKGRGLGLFILDNIIRNTENVQCEQIINKNIFSTKIIIK